MRDQTTCTIRPARVGDAERLLEIRCQAILELAVPALSPEKAQAWAARRDLAWMRSKISANPLWVAEFEEVFVAWIATEGSRIIGLYVDPTYSRRGFASRLLMVAEHEFRASGVHTITLESSRNAEDFYCRHGYEPTADRPMKGPRPMRKVLDAPREARPLRSAP